MAFKCLSPISIGLEKTDRFRMTSEIRPQSDTLVKIDTLCSGDDPLLSPGACSPCPGYQERGLDGACAVEGGYMEGAGPDPGAMDHLEHLEKPGARSYM